MPALREQAWQLPLRRRVSSLPQGTGAQHQTARRAEAEAATVASVASAMVQKIDAVGGKLKPNDHVA